MRLRPGRGAPKARAAHPPRTEGGRGPQQPGSPGGRATGFDAGPTRPATRARPVAGTAPAAATGRARRASRLAAIGCDTSTAARLAAPAARAARALGLGLALLLGAAQSPRAATPPAPTEVQLEVEREGERFRVTARADMVADPRVAWQTLTDYERLAAFVPGVQRARVLARTVRAGDERLTVDYAGALRAWLFTVPTQVRLDVRHLPFTEITARAVSGMPAPGEGPPPSLRGFEGRYTLSAVGGGGPAGAARVRLDYSARFELAQPLPALVGPPFATAAIRGALREQFAAMVAEIERRSRAAPALEAGR